jgi:hypothetical protein
MHRLSRTFKRIHADILARNNLEAYTLVVAMVVLTVVGIVGASTTGMMAAVLAGVLFLVFSTTIPQAEGPLDINHVLQDRWAFGEFAATIQEAHTLWIYGPSSVNVLSRTNVDHMKEYILTKGGQIRVLVQDPDSPTGLEILHRQLNDEVSDFDSDLTRSLRTLEKMAAWDYAGKTDYRLLPYGPGFSLVVTDPNAQDGRVIAEFWGFCDEQTMSRMHIDFTKQQSPVWFEYWVKQYEKMWNAARVPEPKP